MKGGGGHNNDGGGAKTPVPSHFWMAIWLPPSPHSVLLVVVFLTFPLALVLLVGQRVSNPTTINSGWGEGGPWYGTNPGGGHKTGGSWEEV